MRESKADGASPCTAGVGREIRMCAVMSAAQKVKVMSICRTRLFMRLMMTRLRDSVMRHTGVVNGAGLI
jgi:hypothetical protein